MNPIIEALPCPFCGGTDIKTTFIGSFIWTDVLRFRRAICSNCHAFGPEIEIRVEHAEEHEAREAQARIDVIKAWNERKP